MIDETYRQRRRNLAGAAAILALATACSPAGQQDEAAAPPPASPVGKALPRTAAESQTGRSMTAQYAPAMVVDQREQFPEFAPNRERAVADNPVATISLDVDTTAYSRVRRHLTQSQRPPAQALRIEEMINYFRYDYPKPASADRPFRIDATIAPNPWRPDRALLRVGIQGYEIPLAERPPVNLVYLVDVSGSMSGSDRLDLVKLGLLAMTKQLEARDTVGIVTYAGQAGTVLEPHSGADKRPIEAAIRRLGAGGSTAGAAGIEAAYAMAQDHFDKNAVNRVILLTDGDFNVGPTDQAALTELIASKRKTGIYLSVFTVGEGNLNDVIAQTLAQKGNGNAAYLDGPLEARRAMADDLNAAALPIADDVKAQIEFNPARVAGYKLIGYETRALANHDFNDDKADAAEVGSGQSVTLLYEIRLASAGAADSTLRYQDPPVAGTTDKPGRLAGEWAFVQLRYKPPGARESVLISRAIVDGDRAPTWEAVDRETRFATAVAAFGLRLRDRNETGDLDFDGIGAMAANARGPDPDGTRAEFVRLARTADALEQTAWQP